MNNELLLIAVAYKNRLQQKKNWFEIHQQVMRSPRIFNGFKLKFDWIGRQWKISKWTSEREREEKQSIPIEWTVTDWIGTLCDQEFESERTLLKCTRFRLSWCLMPRTRNQRDRSERNQAFFAFPFVTQCLFCPFWYFGAWAQPTNWVVVIKWSEN